MDDRLNRKLVVLLDQLHCITVEFKTIKLETKNFGELTYQSRFLSLHFSHVRIVVFHNVVEGVLPSFVEVLFALYVKHYV